MTFARRIQHHARKIFYKGAWTWALKNTPQMIPKHDNSYPSILSLLPTPASRKGPYKGKIPRNRHRGDTQNPPIGSYHCDRREEAISMPRMSKKRKLEWALFLNHRNRITYNALCRKCVRGCKQSFRAVIIECPRL